MCTHLVANITARLHRTEQELGAVREELAKEQRAAAVRTVRIKVEPGDVRTFACAGQG